MTEKGKHDKSVGTNHASMDGVWLEFMAGFGRYWSGFLKENPGNSLLPSTEVDETLDHLLPRLFRNLKSQALLRSGE